MTLLGVFGNLANGLLSGSDLGKAFFFLGLLFCFRCIVRHWHSTYGDIAYKSIIIITYGYLANAVAFFLSFFLFALWCSGSVDFVFLVKFYDRQTEEESRQSSVR